MHPLPYVPSHVVEAKSVRSLSTHCVGLAAGVVGIPRIRIELCRIVTKVVGGLRPGTSCVFPLRFRRKAISVSVVALIELRDERLRVIPRHLFDRIALCDNDVETSHPREFTLEGRGQCIRWLCPLSLTNTIRLLPAALKQKEAVGRPS